MTASDGAAWDHFGEFVCISGEYAVVGAKYDDDNGTASGSAYIFKLDGASWVQYQKLTASDGAAGDSFGCSVSIGGDYAIVGAVLDADNGTDSGSAYIFKRLGTSWIEQQKLTASDADAHDLFGLSVSISGDYAIAGAWGNEDNGPGSGSAYIFKRSGPRWTEQVKLTASDAAAGDEFGRSVALSGSTALVGAPFAFDDGAGSASGSAYLVDVATGSQIAKLTASDAAVFDWFGSSVALSGSTALVGAFGNDDAGINSGSAYIFAREPIPRVCLFVIIPCIRRENLLLSGKPSVRFLNAVDIDS